ncbi:MAG: insulinase family protein [Candidatus Synoicihabitans palmerolidicus]|nr:insulinase family protein [Candidatus Synoicihabitans palmerolidicus]
MSQRVVSGSPAEIQITRLDQLTAFSRRWYRPDNVMLIASGDFDAADLASRIHRTFADWKRPSTPLPIIDVGPIRNASRTRASLVTNQEVPSFVVELAFVDQRDPFNYDTPAQRRRNLAAQLALAALKDRFARIFRASPGTFGNLSTRLNHPTPFNQERILYSEGRWGDWSLLTQTLLDEYRRATHSRVPLRRTHGASPQHASRDRIRHPPRLHRTIPQLRGTPRLSTHLGHHSHHPGI